MRAIVYVRVSTEDQGNSGAGLNAQTDSCTIWANRSGADFVGPFSDEVSGATGLDQRPQLLEAISHLSKGDVLLVAKRDRIARDPIVAAMIEAAVKRRGAKIISAAGEGTEGEGPTDILMRRIVDAFAEYERLVIKARTKAALQAKIKRGERCGTLRFGFDLAVDGKTLIPNPREQEVIRLMQELRSAGETFRSIAMELNDRGIQSKGGRPWKHTSVHGILARAA